jgi:hypothetical protein
MLNLEYLKSGLIFKINSFNSTENTPKLKDTHLDYYRLSGGFKDANNYYLHIK